MLSRSRTLVFVALLALAPAAVRAQSGRVAPKPKATPDPEQERVYTEEVRIPLFARDQYGRFDPTLERDDIVVLEDSVPQQVRSLKRIPASVLLLLGTSGELNPAQRTSATRKAALGVVENLRAGDAVAVMQFDKKTELLEAWTTDLALAEHALQSKLHTGSGARPAEALQQAAALFADQPMGNRHIVLVTDGVDTPGRAASPDELLRVLTSDANTMGGRNGFAEAMRQLNEAQVTVHVISYTQVGRKVSKERDKTASLLPPVGSVASSGIPTVGINPTMPPTARTSGGVTGSPTGGGITLDPKMARVRKAYERALQRSEQRLKTLATDTGGRLLFPDADEDYTAQGAELAREIGTQYVVTYSPKRPLVSGDPDEYRRIAVLPRRTGLTLRARRGYVAAAARPIPTAKNDAQ
ncbi:MAG TPA: VWA domain-containing protein [Pyrinomonadaceae bacterium]|jgi:VWFA-related protein